MSRKLKQSDKQYRNISGFKYLCYTSDPGEFENAISEAKLKYLKYRIIDSQLYIMHFETVDEHAEYIANVILHMPYCKDDIKNRLINNIKLP